MRWTVPVVESMVLGGQARRAHRKTEGHAFALDTCDENWELSTVADAPTRPLIYESADAFQIDLTCTTARDVGLKFAPKSTAASSLLQIGLAQKKNDYGSR